MKNNCVSMSAHPAGQQITEDISDETGYTSSDDDDNSRSGQYQSIKHIRAPPNPRLAGAGVRSPPEQNDSKLIPALHYTGGGMEYSDSDVYGGANSIVPLRKRGEASPASMRAPDTKLRNCVNRACHTS